MNIQQAPVGAEVKFNQKSRDMFQRLDRQHVTYGTGIVTGTCSNGIERILVTRWKGQDEPRRIHPQHLVLA